MCVWIQQKTNYKKSHAFDYRSGTPIEFDVPAKEDASASPSRPQSNMTRQSFSEREGASVSIFLTVRISLIPVSSEDPMDVTCPFKCVKLLYEQVSIRPAMV
jgi:hypothetical protein